MALTFPSSPTVNDVYTSGAKSFTWDGTAWIPNPAKYTASRDIVSDSSGYLAASTATATEVGYLSGVTSAIQTQLNAKANTSGPTLTGVPAAPTASANTNSTQIATTAFVVGQAGTATPAAIGTAAVGTSLRYAREDHVHPSDTSRAPIAGPTFTGVTTVSSQGITFSDSTNQVTAGVPSVTTIQGAANSNAKTASYTLSSLAERDNLIEMNSSSAMTLTIPLNSTVAYPVGTSLDILQTNTGQVTIAGTAGVTVNATPGLKLRTQWSSATLFKRGTDTWIVYGDLTA
jgi:hypothetical protein